VEGFRESLRSSEIQGQKLGASGHGAKALAEYRERLRAALDKERDKLDLDPRERDLLAVYRSSNEARKRSVASTWEGRRAAAALAKAPPEKDEQVLAEDSRDSREEDLDRYLEALRAALGKEGCGTVLDADEQLLVDDYRRGAEAGEQGQTGNLEKLWVALCKVRCHLNLNADEQALVEGYNSRSEAAARRRELFKLRKEAGAALAKLAKNLKLSKDEETAVANYQRCVEGLPRYQRTLRSAIDKEDRKELLDAAETRALATFRAGRVKSAETKKRNEQVHVEVWDKIENGQPLTAAEQDIADKPCPAIARHLLVRARQKIKNQKVLFQDLTALEKRLISWRMTRTRGRGLPRSRRKSARPPPTCLARSPRSDEKMFEGQVFHRQAAFLENSKKKKKKKKN
jgi:hypothetical protein